MVTLAGCGAKSAEPVTYGFLDETLGTESYAIGFRLGEEELAETVSAAVKALVKNGTYAEIAEKYPDINDYMSIDAIQLSDDTIAEERSGKQNVTLTHGSDLD